jgi:hypothetical protein
VEAGLLLKKADRRIKLLSQLDKGPQSFGFSLAVLFAACLVGFSVFFWRDPDQANELAVMLFLCMGILSGHATRQTNKRIDALVRLLRDEDLLQTNKASGRTSDATERRS